MSKSKTSSSVCAFIWVVFFSFVTSPCVATFTLYVFCLHQYFQQLMFKCNNSVIQQESPCSTGFRRWLPLHYRLETGNRPMLELESWWTKEEQFHITFYSIKRQFHDSCPKNDNVLWKLWCTQYTVSKYLNVWKLKEGLLRITVHVRTTAHQIHFVTFANEGRGDVTRDKRKKMDRFKRMTGMGTWTGRHKQSRKKKKKPELCFGYSQWRVL